MTTTQRLFETKDKLLDAKKRLAEAPTDEHADQAREQVKEHKTEFQRLRTANRYREVDAGKRVPGLAVGGDAFETDPETYHGPEDAGTQGDES